MLSDAIDSVEYKEVANTTHRSDAARSSSSPHSSGNIATKRLPANRSLRVFAEEFGFLMLKNCQQTIFQFNLKV